MTIITKVITEKLAAEIRDTDGVAVAEAAAPKIREAAFVLSKMDLDLSERHIKGKYTNYCFEYTLDWIFGFNSDASCFLEHISNALEEYYFTEGDEVPEILKF